MFSVISGDWLGGGGPELRGGGGYVGHPILF